MGLTIILFLLFIFLIGFIIYRKMNRSILDILNYGGCDENLDQIKKEYIYDELTNIRSHILNSLTSKDEIEKYVRDKTRHILTKELLQIAQTDHRAVYRLTGRVFKVDKAINYHNLRRAITLFPDILNTNRANLIHAIMDDPSKREYSDQTIACLYYHIN
jgi:hypothetical protein